MVLIKATEKQSCVCSGGVGTLPAWPRRHIVTVTGSLLSSSVHRPLPTLLHRAVLAGNGLRDVPGWWPPPLKGQALHMDCTVSVTPHDTNSETNRERWHI